MNAVQVRCLNSSHSLSPSFCSLTGGMKYSVMHVVDSLQLVTYPV